MARRNTPAAKRNVKRTNTSVRVERPEEKTTESNNSGLFEKIQYDLQHNQSYLNLILGGLIVVVLGVLIYNYFNRPNTDLNTPEPSVAVDQAADVTKDNLPGSYTVKEGDTLFTIAQKYYDDGYKYSEIVKANNLQNENQLEVGQKIIIPKLESASPSPDVTALPSTSASPETSMQPSSSPAAMNDQSMNSGDQNSMNNQVAPGEKGAMGTGGAENATMWGDKITSNTYTVQTGDWLSKIAGRAYGDVMQYQKIAQANHITNPDTIEVGTVLQIPRN